MGSSHFSQASCRAVTPVRGQEAFALAPAASSCARKIEGNLLRQRMGELLLLLPVLLLLLLLLLRNLGQDEVVSTPSDPKNRH